MSGPPTRHLTAAELAERAGSSAARVRDLVAAGLLQPDADGLHRIGDLHRVRIGEAFLEAGIPIEALAAANRAGAISFAYYDLLHEEPGAPSPRTYAELRSALGERADLFSSLHAAFGLAEPDPESHPSVADEGLFATLLEIAEATGEPDLVLRVVRLYGEAIARASEAVMTVYDEAVDRIVEPASGLPSQETFDTYLVPWTRFARLAPQLSAWLAARHLSDAIDAYSVESTEHFLAVGGFVTPRPETPPAIAFVDLSGFTRLAEERGDEPVARVAVDFARLAGDHARRTGGRVVKLLGDGVLLRFPAAEPALDATLTLLDALGPAGLPPGHAGIHAGPIIVRDGDVFGRTVNLASRISDIAEPGQLLAAASTTAALPPGRYALEPMGAAQLKGIGEPVDLVRIARP
jgi:class 3 adenylate cyclase